MFRKVAIIFCAAALICGGISQTGVNLDLCVMHNGGGWAN